MVSEAQDAAVDLERGTELEPQAAHQVSLAQQQEGLAVNLLHQPKTERDIYIYAIISGARVTEQHAVAQWWLEGDSVP